MKTHDLFAFYRYVGENIVQTGTQDLIERLQPSVSVKQPISCCFGKLLLKNNLRNFHWASTRAYGVYHFVVARCFGDEWLLSDEVL
jgi:hypothetical protein